MDGCTATVMDKKLSYCRGTTCSAKSVEILQTGAHITVKRLAVGE